MSRATDPGSPVLDIAGAVATITLNRPKVANRLEPDDLRVLLALIEQVNAAREIRVLRVAATGKYFCSGYNVGSIAEREADAEKYPEFEEIPNALEDARPITIAAINGGLYGGATDIALACDFRIGVHATEMFMPAAKIGLHFYGRGMERYVSRLGLNAAKRLFLTAETMQADEMLACGFLDRLVADQDALTAEVNALTDRVAALAPLAVEGMKRNLNRLARGALDAAELARDIARADQSRDIQEGVLAWKEKRTPRFSGN